MPSARKSAFSLQLSVFSFLFIALISIFTLFSPPQALAQENCTDSGYYYFEAPNKCVHKTGGSYDDTTQSCIYDFKTLSPVDENQCSIINAGTYQPDITPSPVPFPSTSPAPGLSLSPSPTKCTNPNGCDVTKENYKAPQNANYTVLNLEHTFLCELAGTSPIANCLGAKEGGKLITFNGNAGGGAMGALAGVIGTMYTPPTSSVQYLAGIIKNFGFAEPAYAQTFDVPGSGASIISPVLSLWEAVRNISYMAFILIFLGVGFMIMFRQKINPQTVVTAQAALPGLVIGLFLVAFSYFIAALIIDLAFIGIPLVTNVVTQAAPNENAFGGKTTLEGMARDSNILQMFATTAGHIDIGKINAGVSQTINSTPATQVAGGLIMAVIGGIIGTLVAPGVGTIIGAVTGGATGPLFSFSGLISLVLPLILVIGLFIQMLKLLMALISTYLQLLIATLTGPFVILASSLPGKGGGIGTWLKTLLANALVFPAVFAAFLFAGVILGTTPDKWQSTPPLFGGLSFNIIGLLLGYGVIMAMPAIPDAVRKAFGIEPKQGGIVGAALGGFTAGFGTLSGATKKGYGVSTGALKREKETFQKREAETNTQTGTMPRWKERLFKRGLPF